MYRKQTCIVVFLIVWAGSLLAQPEYLPRKADRDAYKDSLELYKERYTTNKNYPTKYELAYLIALSRYPDLEGTRIEFDYRSLKTTMVARPKLNFLFKRAKKREYLIAINTYTGKDTEVPARNVPFNGQVGLLAHELAHIIDYKDKSALAIIWDGIRYSFPGFKEKFEKATDRRTIKHGAGWQLYDFSDFVLHASGAAPHYKSYKRRYYMQPHEIIQAMKANGYPGMDKISLPEGKE